MRTTLSLVAMLVLVLVTGTVIAAQPVADGSVEWVAPYAEADGSVEWVAPHAEAEWAGDPMPQGGAQRGPLCWFERMDLGCTSWTFFARHQNCNWTHRCPRAPSDPWWWWRGSGTYDVFFYTRDCVYTIRQCCRRMVAIGGLLVFETRCDPWAGAFRRTDTEQRGHAFLRCGC